MKIIEMQKSLFLQSDVLDPFSYYEYKRKHQPIHFDSDANAWILYSYTACREVLSTGSVVIPPVQTTGLNERASAILQRLARLNDGGAHHIAKATAHVLMSNMKQVDVGRLMQKMLNGKHEHDWVVDVCRKMGVVYLSNAMDFIDDDRNQIMNAMPHIAKLMLAKKSQMDLDAINLHSDEVFNLVKEHLLGRSQIMTSIVRLARDTSIDENEIIDTLVSNFIGLLIQSSDAIRGLLSNTLLHLVKYGLKNITTEFLRQFVIETSRYDPPFHHTRRIAKEDFEIGDIAIRKGETIVIILASANRDERQFANADSFDLNRSNSNDYLSFGHSSHRCPADLFSIQLCIEVLQWLIENYHVEIVNTEIQFEPLTNVRLPVSIPIKPIPRN